MTNADKIAALEREIAALKAATPTPMPTEREVAEWRDQMHAAAEARANQFGTLSPEKRREMERACSTEDLRDLVHASHRPQGPSAGGIPSSQTLTGVHPGGGASIPPGGGAGWARQREWGADGQHPVPGVAAAGGLMDEQDRRDRAAKIAEDKVRRDALK